MLSEGKGEVRPLRGDKDDGWSPEHCFELICDFFHSYDYLELLPMRAVSIVSTQKKAMQREEATEVLFLSNTTQTYVGKINHDLAENH